MSLRLERTEEKGRRLKDLCWRFVESEIFVSLIFCEVRLKNRRNENWLSNKINFEKRCSSKCSKSTRTTDERFFIEIDHSTSTNWFDPFGNGNASKFSSKSIWKIFFAKKIFSRNFFFHWEKSNFERIDRPEFCNELKSIGNPVRSKNSARRIDEKSTENFGRNKFQFFRPNFPFWNRKIDPRTNSTIEIRRTNIRFLPVRFAKNAAKEKNFSFFFVAKKTKNSANSS